jgi:hypothetical protein
MTPQQRGQRLNGLLAEVLQSWGHRAQDDLNASGNIDVAFAIGDQRYILEAKWERKRIGIGPISKLQRRVEQRLAGTVGVFLSMKGYTSDALKQLKDGKRLEVVLLEACHFEAMLTGFAPPSELFEEVLDRAHFYGDPTSTLDQLFRRAPDRNGVATMTGIAANPDPIRGGGGVVDATWVVNGIPFGQCGVSVFDDGRLLLTTGEGLFEFDARFNECKMYSDLSGVTSAQVLQNGEVAIVRRQGVAVIESGKLTIRGGPYGGRITFAENPHGELVLLSNSLNGTYGDNPSDCAAIITVGDRIGEEVVDELDYPAGMASSAIRLQDGRTLVLGSDNVLINSLRESKHLSNLPTNPFGGTVLDESHVLIGGGDVELACLCIADGTVSKLATFNMTGSVGDIAMAPGSRSTGYLYSHEHKDQKSFGAVVRFELRPPPEG